MGGRAAVVRLRGRVATCTLRGLSFAAGDEVSMPTFSIVTPKGRGATEAVDLGAAVTVVLRDAAGRATAAGAGATGEMSMNIRSDFAENGGAESNRSPLPNWGWT